MRENLIRSKYMRKKELKSGMIVQTTHNRFGVVEVKKNRIDFCYDPDFKDEYKLLNRVSLDDVVEIDGKLGIGGYVTEDLKQQYSNLFEHLKVGDPYFAYEIVAVYDLQKIYDNNESIYPNIKISEGV